MWVQSPPYTIRPTTNSTTSVLGVTKEASTDSNSEPFDEGSGLRAIVNYRPTTQKTLTPRPSSPAPSYNPPPSYISRIDDDTDNDVPSIVGCDPDTLGVDVRDDGRIDVNCHVPLGRRLSRLLDSQTSILPAANPPQPDRTTPPPPRLNIVIQVAGSRGDVQPFVALGCALQCDHNHRVRIATHSVFEDFVRSAGLEFYPLGGDPAELMAYIVKNPGLIPSFASVKAGDIGRKREILGEMLEGCWKSCIEPDQRTQAPFVADAIIANPPSMGHVHCAQALSIPLHIMFTMPWSTTRSFSHPLANLKVSAETNVGVANSLSFGIVEFMMWQGTGDLVNRWRTRTLDLEPITDSDGPKLLERLSIPHTYCWSPALVPRPNDWPSHIDVCGFFFREPPVYEPPADLAAWLEQGSKPIYVGFGSIVIDDPKALTQKILQAVELTGTRALVSRGWSKLGEGLESNETIFFLDDCPHEWLFSRVSAVVHHGGAGTSACGLLNGAPTLIVPFFGDQPFWGHMVATADAGPLPIPFASLTTEKLARAILQCLEPCTKTAAESLAAKMKTESGVAAAVQSFHRNMPRDIDCMVLTGQPAAWTYKSNQIQIRLSKIAAAALIKAAVVKSSMLSHFRAKRINIDTKRHDPVSAVLSASFQTAGSMGRAAASMVSEPLQAYKAAKAQGERSATPVQHKSESVVGLSLPFQQCQSASSTSQDPTPAKQVAYATAKSTGRLLLFPLKGLVVDIPLAATEGMRALPLLYNDYTYSDHRPITDWKSGSQVGFQSFCDGVRQGATDIFSQTFARKKKEGAKGVIKGLGIGLVNFAAKTSAGTVGLLAYPCQGAYRSLHAATHTTRSELVDQIKLDEGDWALDENGGRQSEIVQRFLRLRSTDA